MNISRTFVVEGLTYDVSIPGGWLSAAENEALALEIERVAEFEGRSRAEDYLSQGVNTVHVVEFVGAIGGTNPYRLRDGEEQMKLPDFPNALDGRFPTNGLVYTSGEQWVYVNILHMQSTLDKGTPIADINSFGIRVVHELDHSRESINIQARYLAEQYFEGVNNTNLSKLNLGNIARLYEHSLISENRIRFAEFFVIDETLLYARVFNTFYNNMLQLGLSEIEEFGQI